MFSRGRLHFGWLIAGAYAAVVVLLAVVSGSVYDITNLRSIERASEPTWYWFLLFAHFVVAVGGIRIAWKWRNETFRKAYGDRKLEEIRHARSRGRVSGRNILVALAILLVIAVLAIGFRSL